MKLALAATIILLSSNQTSNANDIYINQVGNIIDMDINQDGEDNSIRSLNTNSGYASVGGNNKTLRKEIIFLLLSYKTNN